MANQASFNWEDPLLLDQQLTEDERMVRESARQFALEPALIYGVIRVESNFKPVARSRAGALGLMQVMPSTGRGNGCGDLLVPHTNIACGAKVLSIFLKRYEGNLIYALSAYNGGYRYASPAEKRAGLPKNMKYVERVLQARSRYQRDGCNLR